MTIIRTSFKSHYLHLQLVLFCLDLALKITLDQGRVAGKCFKDKTLSMNGFKKIYAVETCSALHCYGQLVTTVQRIRCWSSITHGGDSSVQKGVRKQNSLLGIIPTRHRRISRGVAYFRNTSGRLFLRKVSTL